MQSKEPNNPNPNQKSDKAVKSPYMILRIQDEQDIKEEIRRKQDEFLDVYSFYQASKVSWVRDEVRLKAYELHLLDPSFSFQI